MWLRGIVDIRPNVGSWHVWIDRRSGAITQAMLPQNTMLAAHADETWVIALHYGTFGGELVRAIYFLVGLVPVFLLLTGVIVEQDVDCSDRYTVPNSCFCSVLPET
ncbi:MAG TPA: PepSY-associated TM helix domain-containing protein [Chloroflexota bacterium]|nr:PepSY-associated TM helix domain-containing protein [Chloroflexota bacterium]